MKEILTQICSDVCDTSIGKFFISNLLNMIAFSILLLTVYEKIIYVILFLFVALVIILTFNLWADTYDKSR